MSTDRGRRSQWTALTDEQLLAQCDVDTYRASGPGGQKRNKTSSAVRLRHRPSGLIVIAEESRSQHENKARALRRLRQRMILSRREPFTPAERLNPESLKVGLKDSRFWPLVGHVLDVLHETQGRVAEAAEALGVSTGALVGFLARERRVWEQANQLRRLFGHKPLRDG
jgi:hypothetical protein